MNDITDRTLSRCELPIWVIIVFIEWCQSERHSTTKFSAFAFNAHTFKGPSRCCYGTNTITTIIWLWAAAKLRLTKISSMAERSSPAVIFAFSIQFSLKVEALQNIVQVRHHDGGWTEGGSRFPLSTSAPPSKFRRQLAPRFRARRQLQCRGI